MSKLFKKQKQESVDPQETIMSRLEFTESLATKNAQEIKEITSLVKETRDLVKEMRMGTEEDPEKTIKEAQGKALKIVLDAQNVYADEETLIEVMKTLEKLGIKIRIIQPVKKAE